MQKITMINSVTVRIQKNEADKGNTIVPAIGETIEVSDAVLKTMRRVDYVMAGPDTAPGLAGKVSDA